jgi:hypothetical protein
MQYDLWWLCCKLEDKCYRIKETKQQNKYTRYLPDARSSLVFRIQESRLTVSSRIRVQLLIIASQLVLVV